MKSLIGEKYGRLLVLAEDKTTKGVIKWVCICECGTTSCGCLQREISASLCYVHGLSSHPLYHTWRGMIGRCTNPKNKNYKKRGIQVCDDWFSFNRFLEDMLESYIDGYTIDRIDNSKGYYKENCRWTTVSVQNHNQRKKAGTSSAYKGVYLSKNRWRACIRINKVQTGLGSFCSEYEAAIAYDNRSEEVYGDRPNGTVRA